VNTQNLTIPALIGLPVAGAYCLALLVGSVMNGGRWWPMWLVALVVSCLLWALVFSGTQRNMHALEPIWRAYPGGTAGEGHSSRAETPVSRGPMPGASGGTGPRLSLF
jgi:hypothetical protein